MTNPTTTPEEYAEKSWDLDKVGLYWKDQLERSARYYQKYFKRCEDIDKLYKQQEEEASSGSGDNKFPMLWSNIQVLQPAVYARTPEPAVERRFKDSQPVARVASELLERNLAFLMDDADIDSLMREVRDDFLLMARGSAWLRYEADIESTDLGDEPTGSVAFEKTEEQMAGQAETDQGNDPQESIADERVCVDFVHWSDFLTGPTRRWKDVPWVARAVMMTKDEIVKRFGKKALDSISGEVLKTDNGKTKTSQERAESDGKTRVWEIWCKAENYTVWIADGSPRALEVSEPPLKLKKFWPCPKPAFGTLSTSTLIPTPDYVYYQGQCKEIDRLTVRINEMTDQLKLVGFYPAGDGAIGPAVEAALKPGSNAVLVPIPSWAAFADKGGKGIVWMPVEEVQKVVTACIENRKQLIDNVYQITGIADIMRGDTEAQETKGAQTLKSHWGSQRIRDRQSELARFARDIVRMAGEIICKQFQPETLMNIAAMPLPSKADQDQARQMMQMQQQQQAQMAQQQQPQPQPGGQPPQPGQPPQGPQQPQQPPIDPQIQQLLSTPSIEEVMGLLHNDNQRGFRIDIETDSTIEPDEDAEKQRRMEFAETMGGFMEQAGPMAQQEPLLVPIMVETMLFVARGFRAGRQLESALEQTGEQLIQKAANPTPPQPSPDEMIKLETVKIKARAEDQKAHLELQTEIAEHRMAMQKMQSDMHIQQQKHQHETQKMHMEHQHKLKEHQLNERQMMMDHQLAQQQNAQQAHMQNQQFAQGQQQMAQEAQIAQQQAATQQQAAQQGAEAQAMKHEQTMAQMKQKAKMPQPKGPAK